MKMRECLPKTYLLMEYSPFLCTGKKTEGISGRVNSLARSRSIIASYPTIDSGINSHSVLDHLFSGYWYSNDTVYPLTSAILS